MIIFMMKNRWPNKNNKRQKINFKTGVYAGK